VAATSDEAKKDIRRARTITDLLLGKAFWEWRTD
jgi:hypothetical protein